MQIKKRAQVEFWRLEEFDFANMDLETILGHGLWRGAILETNVLQRVYALRGFLNLPANDLRNELCS